MAVLVAPLEALTDALLTDTERRVLLTLFSFRSKTTDTVWPSTASIAERANIADVPRVSKITSSLAKKGWLTKKKKGFTGCNEYRLIFPARLEAIEVNANLAEFTNLEENTNTNLAEFTNSNLANFAKCKEQTTEQTIEQTILTTSDEVVFCLEPEVSKPKRSKTKSQVVIADDPNDPPVITIPTNKFNTSGEEGKILDSQYRRFVETYPAVDVWQTLQRIRSWSIENPAKRKTLKRMSAFVDAWLAREQDKPRLNPGGPPRTPPVQFLNSREKNAARNAEIFDYKNATQF